MTELEATLRTLARSWDTRIAVAYNDYSYGQRCAYEQAARELLDVADAIKGSDQHPSVPIAGEQS